MKPLKFKKGLQHQWTIDAVKTQKLAIKQQLDSIEAESGVEARLRFCFESISTLSDAKDVQAPLRRFIFCLSALVIHQRHRIVSPREVSSLVDVATNILAAHGIYPGKSKLAVLCGDLHHIMSLIHLNSGDHWRAAIELANAATAGWDHSRTSKAGRQIAVGIRLERLGVMGSALDHYFKALEMQPEYRDVSVAEARIIKVLRLQQRLNEAETRIVSNLNQVHVATEVSDKFRRNLEFEFLLVHLQHTNDFSKIVEKTRKNGSLYDVEYIAKAKLWSNAVESRQWIRELPKIEQLRQRVGIEGDVSADFVRAAGKFDIANDADADIGMRIEIVLNLVSEAQCLQGIDLELLVLAGAIRWFHRRNHVNYATLTLIRYSQLSLVVSDGKNKDALNLLGNLKIGNSDWLQNGPEDVAV